tara:strand:+ start:1260 stop:2057 length:798 start_codon:yes stop_codon:yes gene_type:complete
MFKSLIPLLAIAGSTQFFTPPVNHQSIEPMNEQNSSISLSPKEAIMKLDTILVFTPYLDGKPQSFKYNVKGKERDVYFAAFSVSAIDKLKRDILSKIQIDVQSTAFKPASLAVFDSKIRELRTNSKEDFDVVFIPDPDQIEVAQRLLLKQGYPENKVDFALNNSPMIFCTKPSIILKNNDQSDNTSIPCSTDYKTIKNIVDMTKPTKKNWFSKGIKPEVIALTLNQFIETLNNSEDPSVKELRVIPTPSSVNVINEVIKMKEQAK